MAQREILSGAVLDLHLRAVEQPQLPPAAEQEIETAANLLRAGGDPKTVLRTLYCLARIGALIEAAGRL